MLVNMLPPHPQSGCLFLYKLKLLRLCQLIVDVTSSKYVCHCFCQYNSGLFIFCIKKKTLCN